jgi:hypothetical protein
LISQSTTNLHGCDVVKVRIGDIVRGGCIRDRAIVAQRKIKRPVQFELPDPAQKTMRSWLKRHLGALVRDLMQACSGPLE